MNRTGQPLAVLFDLDGTLLDTAADMVAALNGVRASEGLPPLPLANLRPHVSHGAARLIELGFGCTAGERFEALRARFLDCYRRDLASHTCVFEGLDEVLAGLESRNIRWGIVTNKPGWLTEPLLAEVGLLDRAACLVCGDTLQERKPHPLPLLYAAERLGIPPCSCVYVGDAERDVQAGRAAGMRTLVAGFGYITDDEDPATWRADAIVASPAGLMAALGLD